MIVARSEIDGIPVRAAPASGQVRAGLVFRVGRADEAPARAGLTHLVEHLVLRAAAAPAGGCGGVSPVVTAFTARGTAIEVTAHLNAVAAALRGDLTPHLAAAKSDVEDRAPSIPDSVATVRYGVRGHGLAGLPEWGVHAVTADDVRRWVATYFTRDNAVLWTAGELPRHALRLELPSGSRRPVPDAGPVPGRFGAFRPRSAAVVAHDEVQPAGLVTDVYAGVLERAVFRATGRVTDDATYRIGSYVRPRGDGLASVTVLAEVFAGDPRPLAGEFTDALAAVRGNPVPAEDLAAVASELDRALLRPDAAALHLPDRAFALLTGAPEPTVEESRARLRTITPEEIGVLAAGSREPELLLTSWGGLSGPAQPGPERAVLGRRFRSLESRRAALSIDRTAITRTWPGLPPATVPFASVAVLLAWPDGGRRLIGADTRHLDVEPTLHETPPDVPALLDAAVPADRHVPLPPRNADTIPVPRPRGRHPVRYGGAWALFLGLVAWVLAWAALMLAITPGASPVPVPMAVLSLICWCWGTARLRRVRNTVVAHRRMARARKGG